LQGLGQKDKRSKRPQAIRFWAILPPREEAAMAWLRVVERKGGKRSYKVSYRDPQGRTRSKTFRRKEDATRFAHQIEADKSRGEYRDPKAGKLTFGEYVDKVLPLLSHLREPTRNLYE
jgi:predicted DNA-binding WGR domain protein